MPSTMRDFLPNQILATVLCNVASNTMCIRFPLPLICSFVGVIVVKNPPVNITKNRYANITACAYVAFFKTKTFYEFLTIVYFVQTTTHG